MRVLITGGAGFVGSHLADACLLRGDEVYVLDDGGTVFASMCITIPRIGLSDSNTSWPVKR